MGFLPTRPKHFGSLREEFIYDLNERLEADKWKKWNKEHFGKEIPEYV